MSKNLGFHLDLRRTQEGGDLLRRRETDVGRLEEGVVTTKQEEDVDIPNLEMVTPRTPRNPPQLEEVSPAPRFEDQEKESLIETSTSYVSTFWKNAKYSLVMIGLVLGFMGSNSALNFGNGYVFKETDFKFPVFMTSFHALLGGLLGICYLKVVQNNRNWIRFKWITTRKQAFVVLLTGAFFALNVGFNNASYQYISVTLNQSIRSLNTVFTAIFCVAIQHKRFSIPYWLGIFAITIGVAMSVYGNPVFSALGIIFALISSICASLMVTLVGYLTQSDDQETKMDSINTIIWTALPIFAFCMPFFLWYEFTGLIQYSKTSALNCLAILLVTGLLAFFYNLFHYELITFTGSVYSTIVGNLKVVFIFLIVAIYTPTSEGDVPLTTLNKWGIVVTVLDFVYMSYISYRESRLTIAAATTTTTTNT